MGHRGSKTSDSPIGVFDSGIGGLTVVRELFSRLPNESLIYLGDTARVPYGSKSPATVQRYATQIADWLVQQGVKLVVVACNTATAHALEALQATLSVPVLGVIAPGARAAVQATRGGTIGVIGTTGTIASGAYERAIHALQPDLRVKTAACPLLVPLIEEGWLDHAATRLIAHEYLAPLARAQVDTLVLGCTHYPLLANVLQAEMGDAVSLIDSAAQTAIEAERLLRVSGQLRTGGPTPEHRFIASDAPDRFLALGRRFLGGAIADVEHVAFT